ncbi:MAG TPA: energy transducer TonB [bacterium]|nr:energy transducer TonB [bacterium]
MSLDNRYMAVGFAASVIAHILMAILVPAPAPATQPNPKEELIEVALFPLDYGALGYEVAAMGVSEEEAKLLSKLSADTLAFAEQLPLGIFTRPPKSDSAPDDLKLNVEDLPDKRLPEMVEKALERLAKSRRETGRAGASEPKPWSLAPSQPKERVSMPKIAPFEAVSGPKERPAVNVESIIGPVSARRIVYRPSLGQVTISTPGNVRIKFWVQPDGAVARILFERKLDASLDDYSLRYVRGLRFEPLPEGKDYVEWGTITIAFRPE